MVRPAIGLWLTTAIWLVVTGGMWGYHEYQLRFGTEIELKTVPVDPRDLLRGDYVVLNYEVSLVARPDGVPSAAVARGRTSYVSLAQNDQGVWQAVGLSAKRPSDGLYLRGRVTWSTAKQVSLEYGIESFFVPEGEGRRYEEARNRNRLWAVVSVSPSGIAYLKRLEIR